MEQVDFTYRSVSDSAGSGAAISVYADRPDLCDQIEEDMQGAGLRIAVGGDVEALLDGAVGPHGDVVLLDCPNVDAQRMAALARLDMRLARDGAPLIVSTSMAALDAVFAAFDQSNPQILVDPTRAERIVAVGRVIGDVASARVRELAEEDRLVLLRLSQQVESIAQRLGGYGKGQGLEGVTSQLGDNRDAFRGFAENDGAGDGAARPELPDPRLVRQVIRHRQARGKFFDPALFADPAWDMLLDLTAARAEGSQVAITSLCIASGVPATTALRWVKQMVDAGQFERVEDSGDRRRAFISLSNGAADAMARYFAQIGVEGLSVAA